MKELEKRIISLINEYEKKSRELRHKVLYDEFESRKQKWDAISRSDQMLEFINDLWRVIYSTQTENE